MAKLKSSVAVNEANEKGWTIAGDIEDSARTLARQLSEVMDEWAKFGTFDAAAIDRFTADAEGMLANCRQLRKLWHAAADERAQTVEKSGVSTRQREG